MSDQSSCLVDQAVLAMEAGEPSLALSAVHRLVRLAREGICNGAEVETIRDPFTYFLHRRGYAVSLPSEMAGSLEEIAGLGEGFDLFELSCSLAELDATVSEALELTPTRQIPELARFHPRACQENQTGNTEPNSREGD